MYNDNAKAAMLAALQSQQLSPSATTATQIGSSCRAASAPSGRSVPGFILGVDVVYTQVWTGFKGASVTAAANGTRPAGTYVFDDEHSVGAVFRAQRNFNSGD